MNVGNAVTAAPTGGQCKAGQTSYQLVTSDSLASLTDRVTTLEGQIATLDNQILTLNGQVSALRSLLSGVSRTSFYGKDTLQFSGMNVQIVNGTGRTSGPPNGLGNLIVGYDEPLCPACGVPDTTGSHDIAVGEDNGFSSYGGLVSGLADTISGADATITGGEGSVATGDSASVSGGESNMASGIDSSVSGGIHNTASSEGSSVSGGQGNIAGSSVSSVSGGGGNTASADFASILGGFGITVSTVGGTSP